MSLDSRLDFGAWAPALTAGEHSEAYLESGHGTAINFEDSHVTEVNAGSDHGAGLRYLVPQKGAIETIYGSINDFDPAAARAMADRLLAGLPRNPTPKEISRIIRPHKVAIDPIQVPMERKVNLLKSIDQVVRTEFPHIVQVGLTYAERIKKFAVLDGTGSVHFGERVSVVLVISVTAERDGLLQNSLEVIGGLKGYEILDDFNPLRAARRAAANAVAKLDAPVAQAGEATVVLAASAGGTFVHEAIGHSLEADHVQEGSSPHYVGKIGQPIAREFLTIVDDPTLPCYRGSFPFDDEGVDAKPTPVVKNGVLTDYLYDRLSGMRDRRPSNGHGRRESFRHRPIPRMSNLYIAPGPDDPAKIIQELDRGLLVTQMGGGEVNTATGEFVFGVDEGFWVEGGKIKHRVRDANILGVGPEILQSIDRLGWDIGWGIGTCGKEGQGVPVADGQPTLRIPKMLIGGR
jgi:TldD protein